MIKFALPLIYPCVDTLEQKARIEKIAQSVEGVNL